MTEQDLRAYVQRLTLKYGEDVSAAAEMRHYALYAELPGCLALASSREAALTELDLSIIPFLQMRLATPGVGLPIPLAEVQRTSVIKFGPIFVGDPQDFAQKVVANDLDTSLEHDPVLQRGEMLAVA